MSESNIEYENKIVIFIDILGFANLVVKSAESISETIRIKKIIDHIYNLIDKHFNETQINDVRVTTFSDSVAISYSADDIDDFFFSILPFVWLQIELLVKYEILIRGGMTYGLIYHDDKMIFGPAMNRAYHLESEVADYPRIIIDSNIKQKFLIDLENMDNTSSFQYIETLSKLNSIFGYQYNILKRDTYDKYDYINYIEAFEEELDDINQYPNIINEINLFIERVEIQHKNDEVSDSILEKYNWLKSKLPELNQ